MITILEEWNKIRINYQGAVLAFYREVIWNERIFTFRRNAGQTVWRIVSTSGTNTKGETHD